MTGTPLEYRAADPPLPHSGAGIASLVIGALCVGALFMSLLVNTRPGAGPSPVFWLIVLAYFLSPFVGLVLGIVGLRNKQRRRVTAVVGLCLNGLVVLLWVGLIGLAVVLRQ